MEVVALIAIGVAIIGAGFLIYFKVLEKKEKHKHS
jgi:hypothetical protein